MIFVDFATREIIGPVFIGFCPITSITEWNFFFIYGTISSVVIAIDPAYDRIS